MHTIEKYFKVIGVLAIVILLVITTLFTGLVILSLAVVPLTLAYSFFSGRSYNSVMDSSNFLYKTNKIGQYSIIAILCLVLFGAFYDNWLPLELLFKPREVLESILK